MREFRIGEAAKFLGVSADTVRRMADRGELKTRRTAGKHRVVSAADLARIAAEAPKNEYKRMPAQSARNRFPGIVTKVIKDRVVAQVEVQSGPFRIVSLMTREAADELKFAPGTRVVASVKATNVIVELSGITRGEL
ncbi:MAG: TOBE domain-containing protein [Planctomycetes bacterium]|nr:TOBE domain-containing protein [Planctomycetota bacterium]